MCASFSPQSDESQKLQSNHAADSSSPFSSLTDLCFGQHTGYGGYGNWVRGGRQVLLREADLVEDDDSIATWIRLETGDVVGSVQLNSTYGQDVYPVTPDTRTRCGSCDYSVVTPGPP